MDFTTFMQINKTKTLLMKTGLQNLFLLLFVIGLHGSFYSLSAQKVTPALIDSLVNASMKSMPQAGVAVAVI